MPTPRVRALKVMTFKVSPIRFIRIRADRIDTGMELPTIREAFRSPKNSQIITMEMPIAMTMVSATEDRDSMMESAPSSVITISRFSSAAVRLAMVSFTDSDKSTVDELCCLVMDREMVSSPL